MVKTVFYETTDTRIQATSWFSKMEKLTSQTCVEHLVSSCGKVISFSSKQTSSVTDSERGELLFSRHSFEREDKSFLNEANGAAVITRTKSAHVEIIKCKCVLHTLKRLIVPCVLVVRNAKKSDGFHYSLFTLSTSNQLEPCLNFKLPYKITDKVSILQGPTVTWCHAGHVWYTSLQTGVVKQMPIQMEHIITGEMPLNNGSFVIGLQSISESDQAATTSQTRGYFFHDGQIFDGSFVLPHPYISVTWCILVLSAEKSDNVWRISSVVITSKQQLLLIENGFVKDVCQLPFPQAEDIQLVDTGRDGSLFVISFSGGRVCAVWKETFTVASEWSGVASVLVDDFLGIGTDQMLLIFNETNTTSDHLGLFSITDLCGVSYSSVLADELMKPSCVQPENSFFTVQALESRLHSGFAVLQELQREDGAKKSVIKQSLQALTDSAARKECIFTPHEHESLVSLWDCDEPKDENEGDKMQDVLKVSSKPQVDKLWHRVMGDRLVVGVILTAQSSEPVSRLSLFMVTETGQSSAPAVIQTQSQVFWLSELGSSTSCPSSPSDASHGSSSSCSEPAAKRSRQQRWQSTGVGHDLSTRRLAVTAAAVLTLLLNSGCVKCHVMLHYSHGRDTFGPASNLTPTVLHCGQVVLGLHSELQMQLLSRPELKTDEHQEDLLSLMALLDQWIFHIDSPDYSLGDIVGRIQKRVGCKRIEVSPQHLLINSAGPSAPTLLRWHQITPFQAELSVHTSELQMLQLLDLLLADLPVSCTVEPVKATRGQSEAQIFSLALEREMTLLRDCASTMLSKEKDDADKRIRSFITPDPRCGEALQRGRDDWQRDVERSKRNLCPLVDVQRYRASTESLFKARLDGDLAALVETLKTL